MLTERCVGDRTDMIFVPSYEEVVYQKCTDAFITRYNEAKVLEERNMDCCVFRWLCEEFWWTVSTVQWRGDGGIEARLRTNAGCQFSVSWNNVEAYAIQTARRAEGFCSAPEWWISSYEVTPLVLVPSPTILAYYVTYGNIVVHVTHVEFAVMVAMSFLPAAREEEHVTVPMQE